MKQCEKIFNKSPVSHLSCIFRVIRPKSRNPYCNLNLINRKSSTFKVTFSYKIILWCFLIFGLSHPLELDLLIFTGNFFFIFAIQSSTIKNKPFVLKMLHLWGVWFWRGSWLSAYATDDLRPARWSVSIVNKSCLGWELLVIDGVEQ